MPDSPVISGVADLPKFYFAEGAPFRLTLTIGAEFSMTGKFVAFGMRARSGTVRRVFGTDSGESNLTIAGQVITLDIATSAATVPAFASGWTLEDVQAKGETEYWVDISATEGSDVLLRLQGQADWVAPGSDIADSSAVVASPSIDVNISSGAVSVSVAVSGGGGTGDVVGPASATDNAIARYNLTTGKLIQDSGITIADGASGTLAGTNSGDVTLAGTPNYLTIANQVITRNQINLTSASAHVTGTLPVANGGTGQTSLGAIDAADFGSGAATDNYVLTADGSGGAAWEAVSAGVAENTNVSFKRLTLTPDALTGALATEALTASQTWNTTGNPTALKLNITNTASGATSKLLDLQIGGSSRFYVDKNEARIGTNASDISRLQLAGGGQFGSQYNLVWFAQASGNNGFNILGNGESPSATSCIIKGQNGQKLILKSGASRVQLGLDHSTTATNHVLSAHNVTTGNAASLLLCGGTSSSGTNGSVRLTSAGLTIAIEVDDNGIGFFGKTPASQPNNGITPETHAPGTGAAVTEDSTWNGYTIGAIVAALKNNGIIA